MAESLSLRIDEFVTARLGQCQALCLVDQGSVFPSGERQGKRRQECRRGTQECVRHDDFNSLCENYMTLARLGSALAEFLRLDHNQILVNGL